MVPQPVRHAVPPGAQLRLFAHGPIVPATQLPIPSHVEGVSMFPVHVLPHEVPRGGLMHAPLESQSVAPQAPPAGLQAREQQRVCVPGATVTPHAMLVH